MPLPFTVVVDLPSGSEIRRAATRPRFWIIAGATALAAIAVLAVFFVVGSQAPEPGSLRLVVTSVPSDATVAVDGKQRGRTPITVVLAPGSHKVSVGKDGYGDANYHLVLEPGEVATLAADLWLRTPTVDRLRPIYPGASITSAGFLLDGRIALTVSLPPADDRQLWIIDRNGQMQRLGPEARGSIALSPHGDRMAYLAASQRSGIGSGRLAEVWLADGDAGDGERRYSLPATTSSERLVDLSWSRDSQYILLVSREQLSSGGQRTRLRLLNAESGQATDLTSLPSDMVPGSYAWSPDGRRVAFLTRSGQLTSLCLLDVTGGDFRYLADLSQDYLSPPPFAPVSWSADGTQLLYAAPLGDRAASGGWLFGPKTPTALFIADAARQVAQRLGKAEGQSPVWRGDGSILALARPNGGSTLVLRQVAPGGESRDVASVPLKPGSSYAARWDPAQAQALIVTRGSAGSTQPEYWLVRFRPKARS